MAADVLDGPLDVGRLRAALRAVAARHPILAGPAQPDAGPAEPDPQPVEPVDGVAFTVDDELPGTDGGDPTAAAVAQVAAEARRAFEPASGPAWRVRLARLGADRHLLIVAVDARACDERSLEVLRRDLMQAYTRPAGTRPPSTGPRTPATTATTARAPDAGRLALSAAAGGLDLPRDGARAAQPSARRVWNVQELPAGTAAGARRLAARLDVRTSVVLLAAFAALLRRLTGQHHLVIGMTVPERDVPAGGPAETIGVTRPMPVRLDVDDERGFAALVRAVDRALGERRPSADASRDPLVRVSFEAPDPLVPLELPGVAARRLPTAPAGVPVDLALTLLELDGALVLRAVHDPVLYRDARIGALLDSLAHLLGDLVASPDRPVWQASARPPGAALPDPAAPLADARPASGLVERVHRWAARQPDATAVRGSGGTMTYRQLDGLRTAVGGAVRRAGAAPGDVVAVLAGRTVEIPAILLGVLGSGARWLLLDPAHPPERHARQVTAAGARVLLVGAGAGLPPGRSTATGLRGVPDLVTVSTTGLDVSPETDAASPGDIAPPARRGYLMSTSGTTGEPALVVTGERPLEQFLDWYLERFAIGPADSTAVLAGLAHDALLRDALAPLLVGGVVCVPPAGLLRDPVALARWLSDEQVTVLHLTPPLSRLLTGVGGHLPRVRLAVLAGDTLTTRDVRALRAKAPGAVVVNGYGSTETPQLHAYAVVDDDPADAPGSRPVPVGAGVPGSQLLVCGRDGAPTAVGELGEVLIRSRNLADGYVSDGDPADGDPASGAGTGRRVSGRRTGSEPERFAPHRLGSEPGDRTYRTGDLGRYDPDGAVVLAGRLDDQVKVRGHRIELGEVEAALREHPAVAEAAVVARRDATGETALAGYVVARSPGADPAALRAWLPRLLPEHARPGALVVVPGLPLTPNGKVDRAALSGRDVAPRPARSAAATAPPVGTATERLVIDVWQDVLSVPRIRTGDNFLELGGHSLSILAVHARLAPRVRAPLHLVDLFRYPTVRALAAYLDGLPADPGLARAAHRIAARTGPDRPSVRHRPRVGPADKETPS